MPDKPHGDTHPFALGARNTGTARKARGTSSSGETGGTSISLGSRSSLFSDKSVFARGSLGACLSGDAGFTSLACKESGDC